MPDFLSFKVAGKELNVPSATLSEMSFLVKSTPRPYEVVWSPQYRTVVETIVKSLSENSSNFLLIDANVFTLYFSNVTIPESQVFKVLAVEQEKNLNTVCTVIDAIERLSPSKNNVIHVVGGGITQDIGAFVACIYKRGVPWHFYPTTLLSMCDSCIGGKTGINYKDGKNQLALFSAPRKVILCSEFLKTLHNREMRSGYGEILKLPVTGGYAFLNLYERSLDANTGLPVPAHMKDLIFGALMVKRAVIEADEFELDIRRSLNYGHTIGHALEVLSGYKIPHGQAVALGMMVVNRMAVRRNLLTRSEDLAISRLAQPLLNMKDLDAIGYEGLGNLLQRDKKTLVNAFVFVLINSPGDTVFELYPKNSNTISEINMIIEEVINDIKNK